MLLDRLYEYVQSADGRLRVDRQQGVIRGVKILGLRSTNGREYVPDALIEAVGLYEGAKVHVNHPQGHPAAVRDYRDRIGVMRQVAWRPGQGLFGDLHFNPKHALAEQLIWDAEHAPENVGFSHNVDAHTTRVADRTRVERIVRVHSVDLVSSPATTRGLFEAEDALQGAAQPAEVATGGVEVPSGGAAAGAEESGETAREAMREAASETVRGAASDGGLACSADASSEATAAESPPWAEFLRVLEQVAQRLTALEANSPQQASRATAQEAAGPAAGQRRTATAGSVRLHAREQHWAERVPVPAFDAAAFARALRR